MLDKVVRDYAAEQLPIGRFNDCSPAGVFHSPEWSMYWPMLLWQQYLFSGDEVLLREMAPRLTRFLKWIKAYQDPKTKLLNPPDSRREKNGNRISDYAGGNTPSGYYNVVTACEYYRDLSIAARVFSLLNQTNQGADYGRQAEEVKAGIHGNLFNGKFYLARTDRPEMFPLASAWPLRFDLVPAAAKAKVLEGIIQAGKPDLGGYGGDAFYSGVWHAGGGAFVVSDLARYRPMLEQNQANWESFGGGEANHAWTAYPGYLFQKYILGIEAHQRRLCHIRCSARNRRPDLCRRRGAHRQGPDYDPLEKGRQRPVFAFGHCSAQYPRNRLYSQTIQGRVHCHGIWQAPVAANSSSQEPRSACGFGGGCCHQMSGRSRCLPVLRSALSLQLTMRSNSNLKKTEHNTAIAEIVRKPRRSCTLQVAGCRLHPRAGAQSATFNLQPATATVVGLAAASPQLVYRHLALLMLAAVSLFAPGAVRAAASPAPRERVSFNADWRFVQGDPADSKTELDYQALSRGCSPLPRRLAPTPRPGCRATLARRWPILSPAMTTALGASSICRMTGASRGRSSRNSPARRANCPGGE